MLLMEAEGGHPIEVHIVGPIPVTLILLRGSVPISACVVGMTP